MPKPDLSTAEGRALKRVKDLSALLWHIGAFVVVNAFLWIQDIVAGGGVEYAFWTTIPWGLGLAFHILAFFIEERGMQSRRYERYLEEERRREMQPH